jgi:hypothetical protein
MSFRFYTNSILSGSRGVAAGIFTTGLALIGFGLLIYLMPRFFATLAAFVFFAAGIGCTATAFKIFLIRRKLHKTDYEDPAAYRNNVRIHIRENVDDT